MRIEDFSSRQRSYVRRTVSGVFAYHPPTIARTIAFDEDLISRLSDADRALGELSGVGLRLREPTMLIRPYVHREAVLSSRIEGTQSSLQDLLLFEADAPTKRPGDAREVLNYVEALDWGINQLRRLPISIRLVLGLHRRLLTGVRGAHGAPGRFRTIQNWIGPEGTPLERAIFVPPPHTMLPELLDDWKKYIHEPGGVPPLIRCALMHFQFETIHPFSDGNGRLGRLLMALLLMEKKCLSQPLLYLSAYFERNRGAYYGTLMTGRTDGDLLPWLHLFLEAVTTQARDAATRADRITKLEADFRQRIRGERGKVVHAMIDEVFTGLYVTASRVAQSQRVTPVSARAAIDALVEAGILRELTGRKSGRVYAAPDLLKLLEGGDLKAPPRPSVRVS